MKKDHNISALITLIAGAVTVIFCLLNNVLILDTLKYLLIVLIVFLIIGRIAEKIIQRITLAAEEAARAAAEAAAAESLRADEEEENEIADAALEAEN